MDISTMPWGPDVSHWHPVKDWAALAASGAMFFAAKATEGAHAVDSAFERHRDGFRQHCQGFTSAVWYHYFHCEKDPAEQAEHFARVVGPLGPRERLCCDFEGKSYATVEESALRAHGLEWLDRFYAALDVATGSCRQHVIYTGVRHWRAIGNPEWARAASLDLWVARYSNTGEPPRELPAPWQSWAIWQYTDGNSGPHRDVPGVGMCDCNVVADAAEARSPKETT